MKTLRSPLAVIALSCSVPALAATTYFDSHFDTAIDNGSTISDGPYSLTTVFGNPSLINGALQFNLADSSNGYEQVRLMMNSSAPQYHIEFDLLTENLANSQHSFSMLIDTPTVQNLNFNNCCSNPISTFNTNTSTPSNTITTLTDNVAMHVSIDIDLVTDLWSVVITGAGSSGSLINDQFYSAEDGIRSIRFGLSPAHGEAEPDPSISVYLDNLQVTSVPTPAAFWLFGSAVCFLGAAKRRQ